MLGVDVSPSRPTSHDMDDLSHFKEKELLQLEHTSVGRTVWWKIDRHILPLCICFFVLDALDRTSIANARLAGLQKSLGLSNYQYTVAITLTLYIITQFPSTLALKYIGPNLMLPTVVILWGVVTALQGLVSNYSGLLACRFFLGFIQGGLPPGIVLYLSLFYPRKSLQLRIAIFFASASLASTFSGLLAAAIEHLDGKGGRPGWAWIFILEGIFTSVFGFVSYLVLPRSPETARFLTGKERAYVVSTLKQAGSISEDEAKDKFRWSEIIEAAKSPHIWLLAVTCFLNGSLVLGLAYFEPTIVAGLGYTGSQAQLMSVPPFALTFVLSIVSAIVSDRYQCRGLIVMLSSILEVIGFSMFYASTSNHVRYASLFFAVPGAFCAVPPLNTWLTNNSTPHIRRATAVAVAFIMAELGGILSTWLLGFLSSGPNYTTATIVYIVMSVCMVILTAINIAHLSRQNRLKEERRQRLRKEEEPDNLGDRSAWFIYSL